MVVNTPTIEIGDTVTVYGEEYEVLDIGPRNKFEKISVTLFGNGIIGLDLKTKSKTYFYDFDVDYVKKKDTDKYIPNYPPGIFEV